MRRLLASPLHWPLSRWFLLLSWTGRRTGRVHTIPLSYIAEGKRAYATTGDRWWRNAADGPEAAVRFRGVWKQARVVPIIDRERSIAEHERLFRDHAFFRRLAGIPGTSQGGPDRAAIERAVDAGRTLVAIEWDAATDGGRTGMTHISRSTSIARPPDAVFALMTDVDRLPAWAATVVETRDLSHPTLEVGCTFRQTFRVLGHELDSEWRVTEFDPPRRVTYEASSAEGGRLEMVQTVRPLEQGSEVTLEIDYELPGGILGRIADRVIAERQNEHDAERSLEALKRIAEVGGEPSNGGGDHA